MRLWIVLTLGLMAWACTGAPAREKEAVVTETKNHESKVAIFAGGCFWGVEHALQSLDGVESVVSGYIGGANENPTYKQVCTGQTGHAEAVLVTFDPAMVSYETLARLFFTIHDPTTKNRQGPDVGTQYRSAVFYANPAQKQTAEMLIVLLRENGYNVTTEVTAATTFYPAETYHQDYFNKHPDSPSCHWPVDRFGAKKK